MQTVALYRWHEVGPCVSLRPALMILHGDEGQQSKQHSYKTTDHASAGMLCGRHRSPGERGAPQCGHYHPFYQWLKSFAKVPPGRCIMPSRLAINLQHRTVRLKASKHLRFLALNVRCAFPYARHKWNRRRAVGTAQCSTDDFRGFKRTAADWLIVDGEDAHRSLSVLTPTSNSACDDRQNSPTDGGYYQLAYDGDILNAPQGWDQGLED
jgi:hypothetical protein